MEVKDGSNHVCKCKTVVTEAGLAVPAELVPFIHVFHEDGDKFVVYGRELDLAKARKNGGKCKFLLGEIMIESGQFIVGDPCFTARLSYDKVLDFSHRREGNEMLVPAGVDKEGEYVGGTVVLSSTDTGDGIFPVYGYYQNGELTKVVIELNHKRWFTAKDEQRQWQPERRRCSSARPQPWRRTTAQENAHD